MLVLEDVRKLNKSDAEEMTIEQMSKVVLSLEGSGLIGLLFKGAIYTDELGIEHDVYINNRTFGQSLKWKTIQGTKRQFWCEDNQKQIAEDWSSIPLNYCRCCHKEIKEYSEKFFESYFDHLTLYSYANGYCKECARQKAMTFHPTPEIIKTHYIRETVYEVGGERFIFKTDPDGFVWYWKA